MMTYCFGGLAGSAIAAAAGKRAHVERRAARRTATDIVKRPGPRICNAGYRRNVAAVGTSLPMRDALVAPEALPTGLPDRGGRSAAGKSLRIVGSGLLFRSAALPCH